MSPLPTPPVGALEVEAGSFRDHGNRVVYSGDRVLRLLDPGALAAWEKVSAAKFFARALAAHRIVATRRLEETSALAAPWVAVLEHERIPFVSYPYEWTFGMLRDAARLTLDLLAGALAEDFTLKDASAYNIQWHGASPRFIDVGSFEPLASGAPWTGYRQFCELFLNPLLLQAYRGLPFQPWLRGRVEGIPPAVCRSALSARDLLRPGVLKHVVLHAAFERRFDDSAGDARGEIRAAGFRRDLILANVRSLRRLLDRLDWGAGDSTWTRYEQRHAHVEADRARKSEVVESVLAARPRALVWDLGANDGHFSRLAARNSRAVVAMDGDPLVVDRLYRSLAEARDETILPLVVDLADPSPALGWRGAERKRLEERGRPELTLCLALLHHLAIGANLPFGEILGWLAGLGSDLVIEFATRDDAMVRRLLRRRDDPCADYDLAAFESELGRRFRIAQRERLPSGDRWLYVAERA